MERAFDKQTRDHRVGKGENHPLARAVSPNRHCGYPRAAPQISTCMSYGVVARTVRMPYVRMQIAPLLFVEANFGANTELTESDVMVSESVKGFAKPVFAYGCVIQRKCKVTIRAIRAWLRS